MKQQGKILWIDDEIDMLKSYFIFLADKGYETEKVTNGIDAIEIIQKEEFDIVFLDENMPGISGLETLSKIKQIRPNLPVIMITKNEAEDIMELAIGKQIADFLTKPVNPSQILLVLKKYLHKNTIVKEQIMNEYSSEFQNITSKIYEAENDEDFFKLYKYLVNWDLRLGDTQSDLYNMLNTQKEEANIAFTKYISQNYLNWLKDKDNQPLMSVNLFKNKVFPLLDNKEKVFMVVIDNFRYDQWKMVQKILEKDFLVKEETLYYSILPTTTQYARNALFSGLMPLQIKNMYPEYWVEDVDEDSKNLHESELIEKMFARYRKQVKFNYDKINNSYELEKVIERLPNLQNNDLNICVLNFMDMLSHSRTEMKVLKEISQTDTAYRSLSINWFKHSPVASLFENLAKYDYKVLITTDHGTIRVNRAIKVIGDKHTTTTNLRYKVGKSLAYKASDVFEVKDPSKAMLTTPNVSSTYIFAKNRDFMVYPNNYNYYSNFFKDSFQHGGISMEEMIIPLAIIEAKK